MKRRRPGTIIDRLSMIIGKRLIAFSAFALFLISTYTQTGQTSQNSPRVFLLDASQLQSAKQRLRDGDKNLIPAVTKLEHDASRALAAGPFSVVSKDATPPSGDKHDYMSQAPYFWPDPKK